MSNEGTITINDTIRKTLINYRKACEQAWCEETASPNLRPIAGKPLSTGQCSATSVVLNREFQRQAIEGYFKIAIGAVYDAVSNEALIPLHVWLQYYQDAFSEPEIIDITADQSARINGKIFYESPTNLLKSGLFYQVWSLLDESQCKERTLLRAEILEGLLAEACV